MLFDEKGLLSSDVRAPCIVNYELQLLLKPIGEGFSTIDLLSADGWIVSRRLGFFIL